MGFPRIIMFAILCPVTTAFPQAAVHNRWRRNFQIPCPFLAATDIFNQATINLVSFVVPEHRTRGIIRFKMEQIHITSQFTVITRGGLGHIFQMLFQFFACCKCVNIDTLQHFVFRVALPICACDIANFERITWQILGRVNVWPTAQVNKITELINRQRFAGGIVFI